MVIPAAMNIESAMDSLKNVKVDWIQDMLKELRCALPDATNEIEKGYLLGLQTARVMLAGSVELMLNKVNPENVL